MDTTKIEQLLAQVRTEREQFLRQVERQIAAYDGAILAYEKLLEPEPTMVSEPNNE